MTMDDKVNTLKAKLLHFRERYLSHPEDDDLRKGVVAILTRLDRVSMTRGILRRTLIGKAVHKLEKIEALRDPAQSLIRKWRQMMEHEEKANRALQAYRTRKKQLDQSGQAKSDMVAYSQLHREFARPKRHGEIPGVPIGLKLQNRGEAAILGIHTSILKGIDASRDAACYAVCISGGYGDDKDDRSTGCIEYTGSGGQKGKRQVKDQTETIDNLALIASAATKEPIRVIRKVPNTGELLYHYEGLYQCINFSYRPSVDGPKVYIFTLKPIPGKVVPYR